MKEISKIETWQAGPGVEGCGTYDYAYRAEVEIIDDDSSKKYVQLDYFEEGACLAVSKLSLHHFDPEDTEDSWSLDSCEEFFTSLEGDFDRETEDLFSSLLKNAKDSKYISLYEKLINELVKNEFNRKG